MTLVVVWRKTKREAKAEERPVISPAGVGCGEASLRVVSSSGSKKR